MDNNDKVQYKKAQAKIRRFELTTETNFGTGNVWKYKHI
jgi:hypothetical protein